MRVGGKRGVEMSVPRDEQLNAAAAHACFDFEFTHGLERYLYVRSKCGSLRSQHLIDGIKADWTNAYVVEAWIEENFQPTRDRNALPELLEQVQARGDRALFYFTLPATSTQRALLTPPRRMVEAALRALDAWPEEWSE